MTKHIIDTDGEIKKIVLLFCQYRDRFRREESHWFQKEIKRIGLFSFRGATDSEIWDKFILNEPIKSEMHPFLVYTYANGREENNMEEVSALYLKSKKEGND